jgi:ribosomal protein S14
VTPGRYIPDQTEGITRVEDLPPPRLQDRSRNYRRRRCPCCGRAAFRNDVGRRKLHDLSNLQSGRPLDLSVVYSKHRCVRCGRTFSVDLSDLAPPGSHYTNRVIDLAVRVVVEDGLPYRTASWQLWRDHRVFVPYATIQNWVEAAGKKCRRAT